MELIDPSAVNRLELKGTKRLPIFGQIMCGSFLGNLPLPPAALRQIFGYASSSPISRHATILCQPSQSLWSFSKMRRPAFPADASGDWCWPGSRTRASFRC